jgi:hypothetical protein
VSAAFDVPVAALRKPRKTHVQRAKTISVDRAPLGPMRAGALEYPPSINAADPRPTTYGECLRRDLGTAAQPCAFVSCVYHLYLDVDEDNGSIKLNFPDREPDELAATCALRVAGGEGPAGSREPLEPSEGAWSLEAVAALMNIHRQRVHQIEDKTLAALRRAVDAAGLTLADLVPPPSPRLWVDGGLRMEVFGRTPASDAAASAAGQVAAILRGRQPRHPLGPRAAAMLAWARDEIARTGARPGQQEIARAAARWTP